MENQYRVSELFYSIQGEGQYAGTPSIWVRVFGCNLKCPGFACDTEYSWNPIFKNDNSAYTSLEIYNKLKSLITDEFNSKGRLVHPLTKNDIHLVFTGGEPLLKKYQKMIQEVVTFFIEDNDYVNFTIESNGTQPLTDEFSEWLLENDLVIDPFFSFSPKLESVSWEKNAIDFDNINKILTFFDGQIKIVCDASEECEKELLSSLPNFTQRHDNIWVMPKGETKEDQLKVAPVVEKYQKLGFKIATRNHCYIWSNAKNR